MDHRKMNRGMTLIELMAVVGIVALLFGILAMYVAGSRNSNAQVDMNNELHSLVEAQRMRASSLGLASYIRFEYANGVTTVEPRIGLNNTCTGDVNSQIVIRYTAEKTSPIVAIDVQPKNDNPPRTLDSTDSNRYIDGADPLTQVTLKKGSAIGAAKVDVNNQTTICFQPNGLVRFIENGKIDSGITELEIVIGVPSSADVAAAGNYLITVTGMGAVYSAALKN